MPPEPRTTEETKQLYDRVSWNLRNLTANLLRVVRGAGKPYDIFNQTAELLSALADYRTAYQVAVGHWPDDLELARMLSISKYPYGDYGEDAKQMMIHGALQVSASRLLGQLTQESAGDSELHRGYQELKSFHANRNNA